jgi:hypothetical protein
MKKEDLLILLLAAALLLAAIMTILRGGEQSRHGYGTLLTPVEGRLITIISRDMTT